MVWNINTIGGGLGWKPNKLLAWGLGYEVEVVIVVTEVPPPRVTAGGGGGGARTYYYPEAIITIRISLDGRFISEEKFKVDQLEIPNVVAKIIKLEPKILNIKVIRQSVEKVEVSGMEVTKQRVDKVEVVGYERNPKV